MTESTPPTIAPARPMLRYHGGKWKLAPWIVGFFPPHRVYVEPYGGGGSVLLRKPRSYAEVYNDLADEVVNVFRVMRDPESAARLETAIRMTPFSRAEFEVCGRLDIEGIDDPVERARRIIFRSFAGFGSAATNADFSTGFRANSNRSHTTPAHDWANYPDCIDAFIARLQRVVIEKRPAIDVIKTHDDIATLHYVDPPYVHSTRNLRRGNAHYEYEMSDADHVTLAGVLHGLRGMVVLSGYPSDLYDGQLYSDWSRLERAHLADGAAPRTEVVWLNPACAAALAHAQSDGPLFKQGAA